jgi:hypothetical protein
MASHQINFRVSDEQLLRDIKKTARREGKTVGAWLIDLARAYLNGDSPASASSDSADSSLYNGGNDDGAEPLADNFNRRLEALETDYNLQVDRLQQAITKLQLEREEQAKELGKLELAVNQNASEIESLQSQRIDPQTPPADDRTQPENGSTASSDSADSTASTHPQRLELSGNQLSKRLKAGRSTLQRRRDEGQKKLYNWSQELDPEGLGWYYDRTSKLYFAVISALTASTASS